MKLRALFCLSGLMLIAACEDSPDTLDTASVEGALAARTAESAIHDDGPSSVISMKWNNLGEDDKRLSDGLSFTVTNTGSISPLDARVSMEFAGLVRSIETLDLGSRTLPMNSNADFFVAANLFPVQCVSGACQARAIVTVTPANAKDAPSSLYLSDNVYYRHTGNFEKVAMFREETLVNKLDANLLGREATSNGLAKGQTKNELLGRVKDAKGGIREVRALSEETAIVMNGQVIGWQTGADISFGVETDPAGGAQ